MKKSTKAERAVIRRIWSRKVLPERQRTIRSIERLLCHIQRVQRNDCLCGTDAIMLDGAEVLIEHALDWSRGDLRHAKRVARTGRIG